MKKLVLIIATVFTTLIASATETPATLTVVKNANNTVTVAAAVEVKMNETFEIQKSTDNVNFTTIAVIMGTEDAANMPAFKMKDSVNNKNTYYRVVKVNDNQTTTTVANSTLSL